jgi:hypothetical protein
MLEGVIPAGDTLRVIYESPNDVTDRYKIEGVFVSSIVDYEVTDMDTGSGITTSIDSDELVFDPDDVEDGRNVLVRYYLTDTSQKLSIKLSKAPIKGSLEIEADADSDDCANNASVDSENTVQFTCSVADMRSATVTYEYETEIQTQFELDFDKEILEDERRIWRVYVDGEATDKYQRDGNIISIDAEQVPRNAEIVVVVAPKELKDEDLE